MAATTTGLTGLVGVSRCRLSNAGVEASTREKRGFITDNKEHSMKINRHMISKIAVALASVAGLALAAESAQAQLVLNGTGSSHGRQFAGQTPALLCAASPTPLLFVSSEGTPNRYEWQCTVNGVANSRIRYSATNTVDAYTKLPAGVVGTAVYLNTAGCPAGVPVVILGRTVLRSVCPAGTPTINLPVHWGGSDVLPSSLRQNAFSAPVTPPPALHLTVTPTVIIPYSIVVGGGVVGPPSQLRNKLSAVFKHDITNWAFLFSTATPMTINTCQRFPGAGILAQVDATLQIPPFSGIFGIAGPTNIAHPSSPNMIACINSNPNSIGYVDSHDVTATNFPTGARQIQIGDFSPNAGPIGTGVARLKDVRCGNYPYWTYWNVVTRFAGVQGPPMNAVAGTNAAMTALQAAMYANNPLPDYWLSLGDTFVYKIEDPEPLFWVTPSENGADFATVCS